MSDSFDGKNENTDLGKIIQGAMIELAGSSAYSNDRSRPYDGQIQTDDGERGRTEVKGLTFRDIKDCFVKGALLCCGVDQPLLYERVEKGTWLHNDIYKIDWNHVDPIAHFQNMSCEMERMMGIYPNVPPLEK